MRKSLLTMLFVLLTSLSFADLEGDLINRGWEFSGGNLVAIDGERKIQSSVNFIEYNTTGTARTLYDHETGSFVCMTSTGDDPTSFVLPAAKAGLIFMFVDNDSTAAADLTIDPRDDDTIDGDTAGDSVYCATDAVGQVLWLLAVDTTRWITVLKIGTWTAN